ncbi:MAG: metallophosphoesterase, partial [Sandaracinaceae bacterium]|nr:metallophosphoesterase [Sandaracinaceae bacterium]
MTDAALAPDGDWTLVVLPDTQYAVLSHPEVVGAQVDWILAHHAEWNVRGVLHVGDITDRNTEAEWQTVRRTLARLPGEVPFVVIPGNHDLGDGGSASDRTTGLYTGFTEAELLGASALDSFPSTAPTSFVHELAAADGPWYVAALEFGPRDETIAWAQDTLT